jgi:hypothetical protein
MVQSCLFSGKEGLILATAYTPTSTVVKSFPVLIPKKTLPIS